MKRFRAILVFTGKLKRKTILGGWRFGMAARKVFLGIMKANLRAKAIYSSHVSNNISQKAIQIPGKRRQNIGVRFLNSLWEGNL
jgi:hypothetical protein